MADTSVSVLEKEFSEFLERLGFIISSREDAICADMHNVRRDCRLLCVARNEDSDEEVRDLVHKWIDKSKDTKADKIIILLTGIEALGEDRLMAEQHGIVVWQESNLRDFFGAFEKDEKDCIKHFFAELGMSAYYDSRLKYRPLGTP